MNQNLSKELQEKVDKVHTKMRDDIKRTMPVFIGSFNPPHLAHYIVCNQAVNDYGKCLVIPAYQNPLKEKYKVSFKDRVKMCELAFGSIPNVKVSDIEEKLAQLYNSDTIYSIELFEYLNDELNSGDLIYKPLIGSDCLVNIKKWKDHDKLLRDYGVIYFSNGNIDKSNEYNQKLFDIENEYRSCINEIVTVASDLAFSSSDIRDLLRNSYWDNPITGKNTADLYLPVGVADYIYKHNLYKNG